MARRLARRQRQAPPESLPLQDQRDAAPIPNANSRAKAATKQPYPTAQAIARAWAEAAGHYILKAAASELADSLEGLKGRIPEAVIVTIVENWKKKHSRWTTKNKTIALRQVIRSIDQTLQTKLERSIPRIDTPEPRNVTITDDELNRLLAAATPAMRLFILLMSVMALRFEEARRAAPEHYDDETQTLTLETKGHRTKTLPVPNHLAELLRNAPEGKGGFVERIHGHSQSQAALRKRWNALKRKAGVRLEVNPHDLRRTAANRVYDQTKDVFAAKELLGHDHLSSTAHYLTPHAPAAMRAVRKALLDWTPQKGVTVQ